MYSKQDGTLKYIDHTDSIPRLQDYNDSYCMTTSITIVKNYIQISSQPYCLAVLKLFADYITHFLCLGIPNSLSVGDATFDPIYFIYS